MGFFTDSELAALSELIVPGYQTELRIYPRTVAGGTAPTTSGGGNDYGDDVVTYSTGTSPTYITVMGWIAGNAGMDQEIDESQAVSPETARAFMPLGTVIHEGDEVATAFGSTYIVVGETTDRTLALWLVANLRKLE